jgi:hypothetical protein
VIELMLHLYECAEPAPAESAVEPLHSISDSATIEKFVVEALHSADDPVVAESAVEPFQSVADSDAGADAPTETYYS